MREYIRPGFAKEEKAREIKKLTAILVKLRECHVSLSTICGDEDRDIALQGIVIAFGKVGEMRKWRGEKTPRELSDAETVDTELEAQLDFIETTVE